MLAAGAVASEAVSRAALSSGADAGRWVRLTEESARKVHELGLTPTKTPGVSHAMIGRPGVSKSWLQLDKGPGQMPTNPTLLAGAPALMAQLAMQQAMEEIADYLATIDAKLDDVLRAQKDSVLAQMIGVGLQIEEAMTIRRHTGRVNVAQRAAQRPECLRDAAAVILGSPGPVAVGPRPRQHRCAHRVLADAHCS